MIEDKTIEVKPVITPSDLDYDVDVTSSNEDLIVNESHVLITKNSNLSDTESTFTDMYEQDPIHMKLINVNEFRYDLLTLVWDKTKFTITRDVINKHVILHATSLRTTRYTGTPMKIADIIYPLNVRINVTTEDPYTVTSMPDMNLIVVTMNQDIITGVTYDILLNFENTDEARIQYLEKQVSYLPWNSIVTSLPEASESYRGRCLILTSGESDAMYCCMLKKGKYVWELMGGSGSISTSVLGEAMLGLCVLGDGEYVI